ncbi:MAG: hypothetical protein ACKV0T_28400 [Planctomycetales bacterium]
MTDVVGSRGEQLFYIAATDYKEFAHPLFRPYFLGEKCPDVDFLVNLWGAKGVFFVQVKATANPLSATSIEVRLSQTRRLRLGELPGPTYLVGVHEPSKRCFIRSIDLSPQTGVASIPLAYELNAANLRALFDEVKDFWATTKYKPQHSAFA